MRTEFDAELEERLVRYARIDSQSDETSASTPSTAIQFDMLNLLVEELKGIGAAEVELTEYGAVLATVPATVKGDVPVIGFSAHVDTAPAFHAEGVKPIVHRGYNGGEIAFPDAPDLRLSPEIAPYLAEKAGDDIITASGTTLLGADDKSGVAIIMTMARHLIANPDIPHGKIRIAFTPDEEIGRGVHDMLPADLGAEFAYTLDGGRQGALNVETFSADAATVTVAGVSTHTGTARDMLVNALHLAAKIIDTLPQVTLTPETTDGRDGFIHVYALSGTAAEAEIKFILRDYELDGLAAKADLLKQVCETVQATEPRAKITVETRPQYRNMRYWLEDDPRAMDLAVAAYQSLGIEPVMDPIRGGTDGSRFTELGVPCPNIFTGQQELHGPLEWISVQDMAVSMKVCETIVTQAAKDHSP
ncbi:MAG: peptidase T [Pseudomonadota bacterium]